MNGGTEEGDMSRDELDPRPEEAAAQLAAPEADGMEEDAGEGSYWESLLPRFSLKRRVTVLVLLATTLVVGAVATLGIDLEMLPRDFTAPFLSVDVPWREAPAREVLDKVVLPLEEELSTVRGLDRMSSASYNGRAGLNLAFKQGTDMEVAYREVRDRIERARARLPDDADRIFISKHEPSRIPIAFVGVAVDEGITDPYDLIQNEVMLRLERIDGVAQVTSDGLLEKEILIELDRQATEGAGLNIYQLAQELGGDNFSLASGNVRAGDRKLLLRSIARYEDVEALKSRLVAPNVRLGDIAEVKFEEPEKRFSIRVNSMPAYGIQVFKEGDANTLEVTRAIDDAVEAIGENPRLAGVDVEVLFDQGDVLVDSLTTLYDSGKVGALFAVAVLFFFLRRLRMTLIITLSIPLSLIIAITVMYFAGESLNVLSLLGLMICVGLLVDNSVVVAENIYRLYDAGAGRREAAVRGAGQIALAIVTATLTTVIVFLPAVLIEGQGRYLLLRMAIPVSVSLLASLVVALVFVPLAVYLTLGRDDRRAPAGAADSAHAAATGRSRLGRRVDRVLLWSYDHTLGFVCRLYERLLAHFLRPWRWVGLVPIALLALVLSIAAFKQDLIEFGATNQEGRSSFEIDIEGPESATFEETGEYFVAVEKVFEEMKDELHLEGYFLFHGVRGGRVEGWLDAEKAGDLTPRQASQRVLARLPERPGVKLYTGENTEEDDDKEGLYTMQLVGEDARQLEEVATELEEVLASVDGVLAVKRAGDSAMSELALVVDRDRAQRQGVNPQAIAGVVGYALRGQALPKFHRDGREIPVRVRFTEEDRESLVELADFDVPTNSGEAVALSSVTDVRFLPASQVIRRRDKQVSRPITLELVEGKEDDTRKRLAALVDGIDLPEGVRTGAVGSGDNLAELIIPMLTALLLSIVFIYLLMAFLFESFILPLSILPSIPLAMVGAILVHVVANQNVDMLGGVGVILLVGVVVNNGIVLIDRINRLRRTGMERTRAILQGTRDRFRPIMMTALTTICGMFPLTLGEPTTIGISYSSFGYSLIGGLAAATLLTLLVVPVSYNVLDSLSSEAGRTARRGWSRGRGRRPGSPAEPPPPEREAQPAYLG